MKSKRTSRRGSWFGFGGGRRKQARRNRMRAGQRLRVRRSLVLEPLESRKLLAVLWDGGGGDNNWTTPENWVGDTAPTAGADLEFPSGASRTNNFNDFTDGTQFGSITFSGTSYVINGNTVALGAGIDAGSTTGPNTFNPSITLTGVQSFTIGNGSSVLHVEGTVDNAGHLLTIAGGNGNVYINSAVNGAGGLTMNTANGKLKLQGDNTYDGTTVVNARTLSIQHASALGTIAGSTTVMAGATLQLEGGITVDELLMISGGGVGGGGAVRFLSDNNTLAGDIVLNADATIAKADGYNAINGDINLGSYTLTLDSNITPGSEWYEFPVRGVISGSGGVTKTGSTSLGLNGANTYDGVTNIIEGTLNLSGASGSLGSTVGGTVIAESGMLYAFNAVTVHDDLTIEARNPLLGPGLMGTDGVEFAGDILLQGDTEIFFDLTPGSTMTISGAISDGGNGYGITANTHGADRRLLLSAANTYLGDTIVNAGTLRLGISDAIPNNSSVSVTAGAMLDLNNFDQTVGSLSGSGNVVLGSANLTVAMAGQTTEFSGTISGNGGLTKENPGTLRLSGDNIYNGATVVDGGVLSILHPSALGTTVGSTSVMAGATLQLEGGITVAEPLTISGHGVGGGGAVRFLSENNTLDGDIVLAVDATIAKDDGYVRINSDIALGSNTLTVDSSALGSPHELSMRGVISGSGDVTKTGNTRLDLVGANTYDGVTNITEGTLSVGGTSGSLGSAVGGTVIEEGGSLYVFQAFTIADALTIKGLGHQGGAALYGVDGVEFAGDISLEGDTEIFLNDHTAGSTMTISGVISDGGSGSGITFDTFAADRTLELSGGNTYSGNTSVEAGTLQLNVSEAIPDVAP